MHKQNTLKQTKMKKILIPNNASDYKVAQKLKRLQRRQEKMAKEELIDKYILGQMTQEEEMDFLQKCKEDDELKEMAIAQAWLVKAIRNIKF
jgi:hypothetical protein